MDWDPQATATDGYICPPCPVFYPSEEEFRHPLKYISSIRHIGMQAGICKIVPPSGWQPPFAINEKTFRFRTRVQQLNCIDGHTRAEGNFVETLRMFLYRHGTPMQELPRADGQLLNVYLLHKTVREMGGYDHVCQEKLWSQVVRRVGRTRGSDRPTTALCQLYQQHYEKCLLAYERQEDDVKMEQKTTKEIQDTAETSDTKGVATKPSHTGRARMRVLQGDESAVNDDAAGDESPGEPQAKRAKTARTMSPSTQKLSSSKKKRLAGRMGSNKNTDQKNLSQAFDEAVAEDDDEDDDDIAEDENHSEKEKPKSAEELEPIALKPDATRKHRLLAPVIYADQKFYQYFPEIGAIIGQVQRVVRGKKPHVMVKYDNGTRDTIDLPTMQIVVANGWNPDAAELAFKSEICQTCLRGDCWDQLLLCDSCNGGHHMFCLATPVNEVPQGDWYCDMCVQESVAPTKQVNPKFGFEMGSEYNLAAYKEKADNWKRSYFGLDEDDDINQMSDRELEREYWRILGTPLHELRLEVEYGSDVDSGSVGSGFPRLDDYMKTLKVLARRLRILSGRKGSTESQKQLSHLFSRGLNAADKSGMSVEDLLKKYVEDGWNLNNLPKMVGSVLQHLDEDIKGVMVPWIYIGMCFSTFCWHVEDHNFYSISYVHCGAPKTWYGVPCAKAEYFESVMKKLTPELFGSQPDLHLQLVTMFSPETLIEHGVPVYRATHCPNQFIVTFPSAYHGGFNNGFNCAEAVNFATVDWLPWGAKSVLNYRNYAKLPVFAHEALVLSLAETLIEDVSFSYDSARDYLVPAVEQLVHDWELFEGGLAANNIKRRELMSDYARRYGLLDANPQAIVGGGTHARTCKMTPEKVTPGKVMRRGTRMLPGPPVTKMVTARPTRMVLWAGNSGKNDGLRCSVCKQYCYLQAVVCTRCRHHSSVGCVDHYSNMCKCDADEHYVYLYRYDSSYLTTVLKSMRVRVDAVTAWEKDCESVFANPQGKPSVGRVKALLAAGVKAGGVERAILDDLSVAVKAAEKWDEAASELLECVERHPELGVDIIKVMNLLDAADRFRVNPTNFTKLEGMVEQLKKCHERAKHLLSSIETIQQAEAEPMPFDFTRASDTNALLDQNTKTREIMGDLLACTSLAERIGLPFQVELLERVDVAKQYVDALGALNETLASMASFINSQARGVDGIRAVKESVCRDVLEGAEDVQENIKVSIFKASIVEAQFRTMEYGSIELSEALSDRSKSIEELGALYKRLRVMSVRPDHLDELEKRLDLSRDWEQRAKKLLDAAAATTSSSLSGQIVRAPRRPDMSELEELDHNADSCFVPTSSILRRQIHSRLQDCVRWSTSLRSLFVRSSDANVSLASFLRAAVDKYHAFAQRDVHPWSRLHCVCEQVMSEHASLVSCHRCGRLCHTQCMGIPSGDYNSRKTFVCGPCEAQSDPSHGTQKRAEHPKPMYPLFCCCRGPEDMSMICCDICDEWYHSPCIGMTVDEMNQAEAYRCPRCAIKQNLYYLDKKNLRRDAIGRRPALARVETFYSQLQSSLIAMPPGATEFLEYMELVTKVKNDVFAYLRAFSSEFSLSLFTKKSYQDEEANLMHLMRQVTDLEVALDGPQGNLAAIHWSLRACALVLTCANAPKYSHLVILLNDSKQPNIAFPRPEYSHIQQTVEDHVMKARAWLRQVRQLEVEEWNVELARRLMYHYHELAQFLQLPSHDVELVYRIAGEANSGLHQWNTRTGNA